MVAASVVVFLVLYTFMVGFTTSWSEEKGLHSTKMMGWFWWIYWPVIFPLSRVYKAGRHLHEPTPKPLPPILVKGETETDTDMARRRILDHAREEANRILRDARRDADSIQQRVYNWLEQVDRLQRGAMLHATSGHGPLCPCGRCAMERYDERRLYKAREIGPSDTPDMYLTIWDGR